jgi:hypothetical protein
MKRRTFLSGLIASTTLLGVTLKSDRIDVTNPEVTTYQEPFYEFFEKFNGFEISQFQKFLYEAYVGNTHYALTVGRQKYGCSTLLLTIAVWESFPYVELRKTISTWDSDNHVSGSGIIFLSSNEQLNKMRIDTLKQKEKELNTIFEVIFVNVESIPSGLHIKAPSKVFYDCSGDCHSNWGVICPLINKTFMLRTVEI